MAIDASTALIFLPFAVLIAIWVAWSDMKFMKIPNKAVLALFGIFILVGPFALPFETYLWRYAIALGVLVATFVLNMVGAMGAGDSKFIAAMAPFFDPGDVPVMLPIFASAFLAAVATHRLFRAIPAMRRAYPDWKSWENPKFPMGLGLSGIIVLYLALGVWRQGRRGAGPALGRGSAIQRFCKGDLSTGLRRGMLAVTNRRAVGAAQRWRGGLRPCSAPVYRASS